jgi:hypothetical protein
MDAKEGLTGTSPSPLFGRPLAPKGDKWSWSSRWPILAIAVAIGILNIAVGDRYAGVAEWSEAFVGGTGLAIAIFWSRRKALWFWPAVVLLIGAHVLALLLGHWRVLPHVPMGSAIEMRGAFGLDLGVSAFFLYLGHRAFDPRPAGWTRMSNVIWWVVILANVSIVGLAAFVLDRSHERKLADLRQVFRQESVRGVYDLMECVDSHRTENDQWDEAKTGSSAKQFFDDLSGKRVRVTDEGTARLVQVETVEGRALSPSEKEIFARCLG